MSIIIPEISDFKKREYDDYFYWEYRLSKEIETYFIFKIAEIKNKNGEIDHYNAIVTPPSGRPAIQVEPSESKIEAYNKLISEYIRRFNCNSFFDDNIESSKEFVSIPIEKSIGTKWVKENDIDCSDMKYHEEYILCLPDYKGVCLIDVVSGTRWSNLVVLDNKKMIDKDEFLEIFDRDEKLFKDVNGKLTPNEWFEVVINKLKDKDE